MDWKEVADKKYTGGEVNLSSLEFSDGEKIWIKPCEFSLKAKRDYMRYSLAQAKKSKVHLERPEGVTDEDYQKKMHDEFIKQVEEGKLEFDPYGEEMQGLLKTCFTFGVKDHNFKTNGQKAKWDEKLFEDLMSYPSVLMEIMHIVSKYQDELSLTEKKRQKFATS
jgi:hypothetical protein